MTNRILYKGLFKWNPLPLLLACMRALYVFTKIDSLNVNVSSLSLLMKNNFEMKIICFFHCLIILSQ